MAYARRRSSSRRRVGSRSTRSTSSRYGRRTSSRSSTRRAPRRSSGRDIRIVIENATASPVARPDLIGKMPSGLITSKRSRF